MSKIEKLQIQGIRSFGNEAAAINIFSPLTLIVGYNGSGKTTIIECLKYATTGELPPNSKGGAFIHDPKLTGEKDQWAQVKMQFKAITGARMVITRNLQLTVKKATRQQKTMECNLVMSKDGEKTSISSRVAELDAVVPQYLGVSKAILENVIFCHQDESLWPMSEPSVLKKKFDEIFEAQKYTKAIENLKTLRKKQREELGKLHVIEQHAKEDKDRADRAERQSRLLSDEIELLRGEAESLKDKATEAGKRAQEAWDSATKFTEVIEVLKARRNYQSLLLSHVEQLSRGLEQRLEPDEILQAELDSHEEGLESLHSQEASFQQRFDSKTQELSSLRIEQSDRRIQAGKFQEQQHTYEQRTKERASMVQRVAKDFGIRGYEMDIDEIEVGEFTDRLVKMSKDQTARLDELQKEHLSEVKRIQELIEGLIEKRSAAQQTKKSAQDQITGNAQKARSLQLGADSITIDEGALSVLEADIQELETKLDLAKREFADAGRDSKLADIMMKIRDLESENENLNSELIETSSKSSVEAKADVLHKEVKDKTRIFEAMLKSNNSQMVNALGRAINVETLDADFASLVQDKREDHEIAGRDRLSAEKDLEQLDYRLRTTRSQVKKMQEELQKAVQDISKATDGGSPEEYLEILNERQENRDVRANDVKSFEVMKKWYNDCINTAKSEVPACRLCKRAFDDNRSVDRFVGNLEKQVTASALTALQKELAEFEKTLKTAREAGGCYEHWLRLKTTEIPTSEKEVESLQVKRKKALDDLEHKDILVKTSEKSLRDAEDASRTASTISRTKVDLDNIQSQISDLAADRSENDRLRGLEEVSADLELNTRKLRETRSIQNSIQAEEKRKSTAITQLELELSATKSRKVTATAALEKKRATVSQVEEFNRASAELREKMELQSEVIRQLDVQVKQEQDKLSELNRRDYDREQQLQKQVGEMSNALQKLTWIDQEIRAYQEDAGPAKLMQCQSDIREFDTRISIFEDSLKSMTAEINRIKQEVGNQDKIKRTLVDNLKFRETEHKLREVEHEINMLAEQNAESDQARYRKEYERWQTAHEFASNERTSKMGTMKAKDDQLMQLLQDWETDFKDAAQKYKRAHIEVETTKAAIDDLGLYILALDQAVMKYHSLKMEEINRIIEELWKRTYQGTDVDTILIRSDNETAKGNRSYNYRVCMVKQDAEMDMRGRCSAGQRVLASIIIRLALAECFGVNCGLIALDEPTTNLDKDNIRSLAESLHDIINARRGQSNFQLIVITHDEEFLRYMRCSDFCGNYFRVQRNDRQKSEIWRNSIAEVM